MHGIRLWNLQGSRRAPIPAPATLEVPRPQRPTTTSFPPDWLRSHGCWSFSYNNHPNGEHVLYMGTLHELRGRTNCGFCQKLYGYLKDEDGLFRGYSENQVLCSVREGIVEGDFLTVSYPDYIVNLEHPTLNPVGDFPNGAKRLDPEWICINDVEDWIRVCDESHGCRAHPGNTRPKNSPMLTLIDVSADCLVITMPRTPYLALSYVWGGKETYQLARADFTKLQEVGSLRELWDKIPQTIKDAMVLTARLGYRYLWVDTLCIVQDDHENKLKHIQQMSSIYSNASITIIAADGEHAEHGLRGVPGCLPRSYPPQDLFEFSPSCQVIIAPRSLDCQPKRKYFTRGWTYQEYLLSTRLLVFVDNRVVWLCQEHEWQEGFREALNCDSANTAFLTERVIAKELTYPDLWTFKDYVEKYNTRNLSYDYDALAAFSGVVTRASSTFLGGFLQALPEFYFDIAILWQPADPLRRRVADQEQYCAPSWSWVGWKGKLDLYLWELGICNPATAGRSYEIEVSPLVTWSTMTKPHGARLPIDNSYHEYYQLRVPERRTGTVGNQYQHEPDFLSRITSRNSHVKLYLEGWSLSTWNIGRGPPSWPCYRHLAVPTPCSYPIPIQRSTTSLQSQDYRYLHCKTARSYFHIGEALDRREEDQPTSCMSVTLVDKSGEIAGVIRLNGKRIPFEESVLCELVAISKGQANLGFNGPEYALDEGSDLNCLRRLADIRGGSDDFLYNDLGEKTEEQYLRNYVGYYEFFNVLWVEWKGGVAYRKALGRVFKEVWEAQALEEVDLVLG